MRGIGLTTAINLNVLNMIGVGPFITLPLMVVALGNRAILGWILGAVLALCDGMVWAELGTRFPESGGSYLYLNRLYGVQRWGRLLSFLYIWQLTFSAPLVDRFRSCRAVAVCRISMAQVESLLVRL